MVRAVIECPRHAVVGRSSVGICILVRLRVDKRAVCLALGAVDRGSVRPTRAASCGYRIPVIDLKGRISGRHAKNSVLTTISAGYFSGGRGIGTGFRVFFDAVVITRSVGRRIRAV